MLLRPLDQSELDPGVVRILAEAVSQWGDGDDSAREASAWIRERFEEICRDAVRTGTKSIRLTAHNNTLTFQPMEIS